MEKYIVFSILRKIFEWSDFRKSVFFNDFVSTKIQSTEPWDTYPDNLKTNISTFRYFLYHNHEKSFVLVKFDTIYVT